MFTITNKLLVFFTVLLLSASTSSCDVWAKYDYYIYNELESDTITMIAQSKYMYEFNFNPSVEGDSLFIIPPHKFIKFTKTDVICGFNLIPDDYMNKHPNELGELKLLIKNDTISGLWKRKFWQFSAENRTGIYIYYIDESIINQEPNKNSVLQDKMPE